MKEQKYSSEFCFLKGYLKSSEMDRSINALTLMYNLQQGQLRKDGITGYYEHPVRVANHLLNLFGHRGKNTYFSKDDFDILIASALTHDVIEDYHGNMSEAYEKICSACGKEVADIVDILTKTKEKLTEEYYNGIRKDLKASLIKGTDRCHNVSTMAGVFNKTKLNEYVCETENFVLPLLRHVRDTQPMYSEKIVLISYHIKSVLEPIKLMIPLME